MPLIAMPARSADRFLLHGVRIDVACEVEGLRGEVPAAVVARAGCGGVLLLSPFGIDDELARLEAAGYRVIGRRWTCLREDVAGRRVVAMPFESGGDAVTCDAVVVITPGRRAGAVL